MKFTSRVQRAIAQFVGDLDFEPVVTFRERRQRHRLAGLELMAEPLRSNCGGNVWAFRF